MSERISTNNQREETAPPIPTEIASVYDTAAREKAAQILTEGGVIGSYNRGVCAIWANGADAHAVERIAHIKGELRGERPLAGSLRTKDFVALLDPSKIPPHLHDILLNADKLAASTSSLCFIRGPITPEATKQVPASMISRLADGTPILQNWDPEGHEPTLLLLEEMYKKGIRYPAVTSMNPSGIPEYVTEEDGISFSEQSHIPMFLTDPKDPRKVQGSYTILGIHSSGIEVVRDGNIPAKLIERLLDVPLDYSNTKAPKHPQAQFPDALIHQGQDPAQSRVAILTFVSTA